MHSADRLKETVGPGSGGIMEVTGSKFLGLVAGVTELELVELLSDAFGFSVTKVGMTDVVFRSFVKQCGGPDTAPVSLFLAPLVDIKKQVSARSDLLNLNQTQALTIAH